MKRIILSLFTVTISALSFAQAHLATADYQKTMQPAVENEYPFPEKTVSKAIDDKMQKLGYKGKDNKGYVIYRGVRIAELGPDAYDLYFKVDKRSKKENTVVTMLVSSGYDKFIGDSSDNTVIDNSKKFLDSLINTVAAYDLEMQITEQEDVAKKADRRWAGLVDDGADLQKKKAKIEKEIEENIKKQADQKVETEKQRQILDTLKSKRKQ